MKELYHVSSHRYTGIMVGNRKQKSTFSGMKYLKVMIGGLGF